MNKMVLAFPLLGLLAGSAAAQSSVTVYGAVDAYYLHDSGNGRTGSIKAIEGGAASLGPSRLGFRGREDLGGGLAAIYTAEMGFGPDTGNFDVTGVGFGRQAFFGLQGDFGVVKLGRQYNPLFNGGSKYDSFYGGQTGAYTRLISLGAGKRFNNAIVYGTPASLGGLNAELAYSVGEVAGDSAKGRAIGTTIGYTNGPFSTSLIYNNFNNIPAELAPVVTTRNTGLGAAYNFGILTLSGLFQTNKSNATAALDTRDYLVGVRVPIGASTAMVSYIHHKNVAGPNADTRQVAAGYTYPLSKRTTLFTSYARVENDSSASILTPDNPGGSNNQFNIGIDHTF